MKVRHFISNISTNLALWFCLSSVVLTIILSHVVETVAAGPLREQIGQKLWDLAFLTSDKIDHDLFERYREVQLLAARVSIGDLNMSLATRQQMLRRIQGSYEYYSWIGMTDMTGKVLVSGNGILEGASVAQRPWFINAKAGTSNVGKLHDSNLLNKILPAPASGEPLRFVDVAFPYYDLKGNMAGVLGAHLSWEWARKIEQSVITPSARRSNIEVMIVDEDGIVLFGPKSLLGTRVSLPALKSGQAGTSHYAIETWADNKRYLAGYSKTSGHGPYLGFGWWVVVRQDADEAFAPLRGIQRRVLWSGLTIALLFSLFGVFNARRITRPLVEFAGSVKKFRLGEIDTLTAPSGSYREIKELGDSFVELVGNLERNEADLKELNATLEKRVMERTTELELSERRLLALARHDTLTGLPNRYQLTEKLDEAVRRCRRTHMPMAVMFLDIDKFKEINDSLGHGVGDEVLKEFGSRLKAGIRSTDTVARLAGDEFIILLEGLLAPSEAERLARKIIDRIAEKFLIDGLSIPVTTSIGIAYTDGSNLNPDELMAHADRVLYESKANGRNQFTLKELSDKSQTLTLLRRQSTTK